MLFLLHDVASKFSFMFHSCIPTTSGGIKPCVSAFGADQISLRYRAVGYDDGSIGAKPEEEYSEEVFHDDIDAPLENEASEQVRQFFAYFYFCINVGAVLSFVVVPLTRDTYGFGPAFSLSLLFFSFALSLFLWKRKEYVHHVPGTHTASLSTNFILCWWLLRHGMWQQTWFRTIFPFLRPSISPPVFIPANDSDATIGNQQLVENDLSETPIQSEQETIFERQMSDAAQAIHVLPILAMFPTFWCLYDQQSSVWTIQATKMKLDWHLTPENMNAVNPLEIMVFIPVFDRIVYPTLQSLGWNISPLRRIGFGMILTAVSFSVSGLVESIIEYRATHELDAISVLWQLPQITILSVAEIFVSVTGLEFAYATSPDRLKAFLMALFLLTTAVGDFFSGILYSTVFVGVDRAKVMHICAFLMLGNFGLFYFVARWWETRDAHELRRMISLQGDIELRNRWN